MSINVFVVDLIYSFITKSSPQALLFFNFVNTFKYFFF